MSNKPAQDAVVLDHGVAPIPESNLPGHRPATDPDKPLVPHEALRVDPPDDDPVPDDGVATRFAFAFEPLLVPFAAAMGVVAPTSWVEVGGEELEIRFGPWVLRTTLENVAGWEVTTGFRFLEVAGPPRLSLSDQGVTFATNRRSGLRVQFHEPVRALDPTGHLRHPAATVTVTSPEQLAMALDRAGTSRR